MKVSERASLLEYALIILFYGTLIIGMLGGWVLNVYKFAKCDFETPYKTEIVRGVGIPMPPFGIVIGWMAIGEEVKGE